MVARCVGLAMAMAALALGAAPAGADIGAPGLGDPLFPLAGNGGYDVAHYGLTLDYDRASGQLDATAVISARATQSLTRFDLDLRGFDISLLLVDGRPASYRRAGQELIVTPREGLRKGRDFTVIVRYAGVPEVITDPDESIEGWVPTADGAFVVGEPQGAPGWFPSNDNPQDKATFDEAITVPDGITALGKQACSGQRLHTHPKGGSHRDLECAFLEWRPAQAKSGGRVPAERECRQAAASRQVTQPTRRRLRSPGLPRRRPRRESLAQLGPLLDESAGHRSLLQRAQRPVAFNRRASATCPTSARPLRGQTKPIFACVPDAAGLIGGMVLGKRVLGPRRTVLGIPVSRKGLSLQPVARRCRRPEQIGRLTDELAQARKQAKKSSTPSPEAMATTQQRLSSDTGIAAVGQRLPRPATTAARRCRAARRGTALGAILRAHRRPRLMGLPLPRGKDQRRRTSGRSPGAAVRGADRRQPSSRSGCTRRDRW